MVEIITISLITTVSAFGALTLLPLWIGMITDHPRLRRLALVPSIPYVFAAVIINIIIIIGLNEVVPPPILVSAAYSTGFSAFSLWLITWALFKKWRQE